MTNTRTIRLRKLRRGLRLTRVCTTHGTVLWRAQPCPRCESS